MNHPENRREDDSEYEYDDTETETFFVDIDLSSLNANIKSNLPVPPKPVPPAKRKISNPDPDTPAGPDEPGPDAAVESGAEDAQGLTQKQPHDTPPRNGEDDENAHLPAPSRVQILDLDTVNPIISYRGQVYSCMWTDMVGTNMFFTHPGVLDAAEVLQSTDDYDLISMSRIKLVSQAAKMLKKEKPTKEAGIDDQITNDQAGGSNETPEARSAEDQMRKQASFLEKLTEIKRQRGETDAVRTFVDERTASVDLALVHESHRDEIQDLNAKVVGGDADALARLQEIYSQSDGRPTQIRESSERPPEAHNEANITM